MQKYSAQKKANCFVVFMLSFCLLNIGNIFFVKPKQIESMWGNEKSSIALIYIIEFRDILCSPCSESFLNFCLSLPPEYQRENTWGVVVFDQGSQINLGEKIIAKKVRGFIKGNQLHFPLLIDKLHIFKTLRTQATQLLLLDSSSLTIKNYDFPLSENDKNTILMLVLDNL